MPVTVEPSKLKAESVYDRYEDFVGEPLALLKGACKKEHEQCLELVQSSFNNNPQNIKPSGNGFVYGAIEAYSEHHHLQIRPEDIWFAILSQLSFYINRHAEDLRGKLVAHEGKKELVVEISGRDHYSVDFGVFATAMSDKIDTEILDRTLKDWVMPAFSTTTEEDKVVASVLFMGSMQEYFAYVCAIRCGLPSVTLLGEKSDWVTILNRLDKLKEFGDEPTQFQALLRPIISRFILSFENPHSEVVKSFWNRIAHKIDMGSGPDYYSGWISAFCFWNLEGKIKHWEDNSKMSPLHLDDAVYHAVSSAKFPAGYLSVPFKIDDYGEIFDALIVAGSVGMKFTKSSPAAHKDTVSAKTGWWVFEKKPDKNVTEEKKSPK